MSHVTRIANKNEGLILGHKVITPFVLSRRIICLNEIGRLNLVLSTCTSSSATTSIVLLVLHLSSIANDDIIVDKNGVFLLILFSHEPTSLWKLVVAHNQGRIDIHFNDVDITDQIFELFKDLVENYPS